MKLSTKILLLMLIPQTVIAIESQSFSLIMEGAFTNAPDCFVLDPREKGTIERDEGAFKRVQGKYSVVNDNAACEVIVENMNYDECFLKNFAARTGDWIECQSSLGFKGFQFRSIISKPSQNPSGNTFITCEYLCLKFK